MYIYILDFSQNGIYEIKYNDEEYDNLEDLFNQYGLNIDNCNYMISEVKLEIEQIEKI